MTRVVRAANKAARVQACRLNSSTLQLRKLCPSHLLQVLIPLDDALEFYPVGLAGPALELPVQAVALVRARRVVALADRGQGVRREEGLVPVFVPHNLEFALDLPGPLAAWQCHLQREDARLRSIWRHPGQLPIVPTGDEVIVPGVSRRCNGRICWQLVPGHGQPLPSNLQLDFVLVTWHAHIPAADLEIVQFVSLLCGLLLYLVRGPARPLGGELELVLEEHVKLAVCVRGSKIAKPSALWKPLTLRFCLRQRHCLLQEVPAHGDVPTMRRELEPSRGDGQGHQLGAAVDAPVHAQALLLICRPKDL
mmetsp:Transcript_61373/g.170186  ORF Transcript_61373/g.170186 Transcript_61373/m.170186 type:complete len:308 (-) Transcript_61373:2353-3276(-)